MTTQNKTTTTELETKTATTPDPYDSTDVTLRKSAKNAREKRPDLTPEALEERERWVRLLGDLDQHLIYRQMVADRWADHYANLLAFTETRIQELIARGAGEWELETAKAVADGEERLHNAYRAQVGEIRDLFDCLGLNIHKRNAH